MAANDQSRKSSKRRASGGRSSEGAGARKASRSRSAVDDGRKRSGTSSAGTRGAAAKKSPGSGSASRASSAAQGARRASQGRKSESRTESRSDGARKSAARRGSTPTPARGRKSAERGRSRGRMDALKLLKEDHDRVDQMFKRYDRMKEGDDRKQSLLQQILDEVRVHAQLEEEIFYPALRALFEQGGKDKELELIEEADVEHETVKWLMEQLEGEQSDEGMRDARVKVMGEYIRHHVEEEEGQMFKAARKVNLDLEEVGRRLDARKRQLKGEEPADQEGGDADAQVSEPAQMATTGSTH